ncbi:MAG TPA: DEAD/DEAH box helicase, partial [Gammaproteobacteria bacterium]|nr:DEAD/DEAH box helicase [Gammaproteobacteria bacterium]
MITFSQLNLDINIQKALDQCGYKMPTPIQEKAIPPSLEGQDVMGCAPTGTGKTAAFVLPALHHLSQQKPSKKPRILVLTPTRELAAQITQAARQYGKYLRFNIISLLGGMPYHQQIRDLQRGADIVIATPGRLLDHAERQRIDLSGVDILILDEADRMLDMGFIDDVQTIAQLTPSTRQTLLFSATLDKQLGRIAQQLLNDPVRIDCSSEKIAAPKIKQILYKTNNFHDKANLLKQFLNDETIYKAIMFSNRKVDADKLAAQLRDQGYSASALHGDLKQNVRTRTIEQLRRGKIQYLVATDVAARGIDIPDITHVINYDLPKFCEDYVHRIGRTGRAGKEGIAISFVLPTDTKHLRNIERYLGQSLKLIQRIDGQDVEIPISSERPRPHSDSKRGYKPAREHYGHRRSGDDGSSEKKKYFGKRSDRSFDGKPSTEKSFGDRKFGDKKPGEGRFGDKKFGEG